MAVRSAQRALDRPGAPDLLVHLDYGVRDAGGYARELIAETVVHSWDLSRALGEHGRMPPGSARYALTEFHGYRDLADSGRFDPPFAAPPGADAEDQLLALTGRDPAWSADRI